ncbi:hypothetical protein THAOC_01866, partial [Thalassiosira oceanica]
PRRRGQARAVPDAQVRRVGERGRGGTVRRLEERVEGEGAPAGGVVPAGDGQLLPEGDEARGRGGPAPPGGPGGPRGVEGGAGEDRRAGHAQRAVGVRGEAHVLVAEGVVGQHESAPARERGRVRGG